MYNSNFKQTSPTLSPLRHSSLTLSILFILISQYLHLSQVYDCTPITIHTSPYIHTPLLTTSTLPAPLTCTSHRPDPPSRLFLHLVSKIIVAIVDPPNLGRRPEHITFWPAAPLLRPSAGLVDGTNILWPAAAIIQTPSLHRSPTMMKTLERRSTTAER